MFNNLEEFIQTIKARFNKPRRNLLNEGVVKDDLVESFVDLSKFVEGKVGLIGQAVDEAVDAKNQAAAQYQAKNIFRLRSENDPAEDFDRPEGTLLKNITTVTGHTFHATGPAGDLVRVKNNAMNCPGNVYAGLTSSKKVTRVSGVFSYDEFEYGHRPVIMFNGGPLDNDLFSLIHLEMGPEYWSLKFTDTGAPELRNTTGTITERNGKLVSEFYLKPLVLNEQYFVAMEYTKGATDLDDIISVFLHDGRIFDFKGDPIFRVIMDKCFFGTWQLKGPTTYWHTVALGESRARTVNELGLGVSKLDLLPLTNLTRNFTKWQACSFKPTGVGWYKIATSIVVHPSISALIGTFKLLATTGNGMGVFAEIDVNSYHTRVPTIETKKYGYGDFGGVNISKVRISHSAGSNNANGEKQLEIYVNAYNSVNDIVTIEFGGYGQLVKNPVVGSTVLPLLSREQNILDTRRGVTVQSTATGRTFTPGIDPVKNILNTNYKAGGEIHLLDDTKAQPTDEFFFIRSNGFANNAIIRNLSDNSEIVSISPGQTAWIGVSGGKFVLLSKGTV